MQVYHDLLQNILDNGHDREARYGPTRALFAQQLRFDMADGFPAVTTKKLPFRTMAVELLWFLSGSEDNNELTSRKCNIWTANGNADYWKPKAKYDGHLGRVYGVQWRRWRRPDGTELDQLADVVERIKTNPYDRRLIVSAWNPGELNEMVLPPCHMIYQFFVADNKISLHMNQRSADMFLGVPFNIASYSLLLHLVAQITGLIPHELVMTLADAHICGNHMDQVREQLGRTAYPLPQLWLNPEITSLDDIALENYPTAKDVTKKFARLLNYEHHPTIKAEMGV